MHVEIDARLAQAGLATGLFRPAPEGWADTLELTEKGRAHTLSWLDDPHNATTQPPNPEEN